MRHLYSPEVLARMREEYVAGVVKDSGKLFAVRGGAMALFVYGRLCIIKERTQCKVC